MQYFLSGCILTEISKAVRWEVNVIITDVTKTWLDLRSALQGKIRLESN